LLRGIVNWSDAETKQKSLFKEEKILKVSLDLIPSPSLKIQIMGRKVCWPFNKLLKTKSLLTSTRQWVALLLHLDFLANNLNFHGR